MNVLKADARLCPPGH